MKQTYWDRWVEINAGIVWQSVQQIVVLPFRTTTVLACIVGSTILDSTSLPDCGIRPVQRLFMSLETELVPVKIFLPRYQRGGKLND